jgi:hypothetical protein
MGRAQVIACALLLLIAASEGVSVAVGAERAAKIRARGKFDSIHAQNDISL